MKQSHKRFAGILSLAGSLTIAVTTSAETIITTFDDFFSLDGLFAWSDAIVDSTPTNYALTDVGYGSGYEDINPNIDATGETTVQLTVVLSAPGAGFDDPISGPIVSLVDGDGTFYNYAWYGQTSGVRILTAPLDSPTFVTDAGTVPGLDLTMLDFLHLQNDPGAHQGEYTITFEDLRLIGAPGPAIIAQTYDPDTLVFSLTWSSKPQGVYSILYAPELTSPFQDLMTDIASDGETTTAWVTLPAGGSGFLVVREP